MSKKDSEIFSEAAQKLYDAIMEIKYGRPFHSFNFIMLHNIYMLGSVLYYHLDESILSDTDFDKLCKYLLNHFDEAKKVIRHADETFVKANLEAGTGYNIKFNAIWWNIAQHYQRIK